MMRIFEEVKQRPQFVVTKLLNFDGSPRAASSAEEPARERAPK